MICYTNKMMYSNDIAEIIRLFSPTREIDFTEFLPQDENCDERLNDIIYVVVAGSSIDVSYHDMYCEETIEEYSNALEQKRHEKGAIKRAVFRIMKAKYPDKNLPWGALTGVRPTRLLRDTANRYGEQEALTLFRNHFFVQDDKIQLLQKIANTQKRLLVQSKPNEFDLYIGIPFCTTKCSYCSFGSYEIGKVFAKQNDINHYITVLINEIELNLNMAYQLGYSLRAVYIGGGTPTALTAKQLEALLLACQNNFSKTPIEWTVEAGRPDTLDKEKLSIIKNFGISRISINPQTIHDETLARIGRSHTNADFLNAYNLAQQLGFNCINTDVIIGLPGENADMVAQTMEAIGQLQPANITVHTLAIKRSAELKYNPTSYHLADDDEAREMLHITQVATEKLGLEPYYLYRQKYMSGALENVGYAYPSQESLYNVGIMEEVQNILALGAGGISKWIFNDIQYLERIPNPKDITTYFQKQDDLQNQREKCMKKALC